MHTSTDKTLHIDHDHLTQLHKDLTNYAHLYTTHQDVLTNFHNQLLHGITENTGSTESSTMIQEHVVTPILNLIRTLQRGLEESQKNVEKSCEAIARLNARSQEIDHDIARKVHNA